MFRTKRALLFLIAASFPVMAQLHVVLYNSGSNSWTDLAASSPLGSGAYVAHSITSAGAIAGTCADAGIPCTYSEGTWSAVPGLSATPLGDAETLNGSLVAGVGHASAGVAGKAWVFNGSSVTYLPIGNGSFGSVGTASGVQAMNASGVLVGSYTDTAATIRTTHAFSYSSGTLTDLTPSAVWSIACAIDSSGNILVNFGPSSPTPTHVGLYSGGMLTDLGAIGNGAACWGQHTLEDSGGVWVGDGLTDGSGHEETFYYNGLSNLIPYLPVDASNSMRANYASAVNNGVVVGWSYPSNHPFSYTISGAVLTDLGLAKTSGGNWNWVQPTDINASGQIVGVAY